MRHSEPDEKVECFFSTQRTELSQPPTSHDPVPQTRSGHALRQAGALHQRGPEDGQLETIGKCRCRSFEDTQGLAAPCDLLGDDADVSIIAKDGSWFDVLILFFHDFCCPCPGRQRRSQMPLVRCSEHCIQTRKEQTIRVSTHHDLCVAHSPINRILLLGNSSFFVCGF